MGCGSSTQQVIASLVKLCYGLRIPRLGLPTASKPVLDSAIAAATAAASRAPRKMLLLLKHFPAKRIPMLVVQLRQSRLPPLLHHPWHRRRRPPLHLSLHRLPHPSLPLLLHLSLHQLLLQPQSCRPLQHLLRPLPQSRNPSRRRQLQFPSSLRLPPRQKTVQSHCRKSRSMFLLCLINMTSSILIE